MKTSMDKLKRVWKEDAPGAEFLASFLIENIDAWYKSQERLSQILKFPFKSGGW